MVLAIHCAQHGATDGLSRLVFYLDEESHNLLGMTGPPHRTHLLHFLSRRLSQMARPTRFSAQDLVPFLLTNAVVQSRFTNYSIGSRPISGILQAVFSSITPSGAAFRELRRLGLVRITNEQLWHMEHRAHILPRNLLDELRLNGGQWYERTALQPASE